MSRLALGTAQFGLLYGVANQGGQVARADASVMVQLAKSHGVDTVDTAVAYGESETCLGEIGTQCFKVVTKLPAVPNGCANVHEWIHAQVRASLERLRTASLYGVLLHRPDQLLQNEGDALYRALLSLKDTGRVQHVGASVYAPSELEALTAKFRFDLVQAPFNLIDSRLHKTNWLRRLKDAGVEVHTRSTFLQGLLLLPRAAIPSKFAPWSDVWSGWHEWLATQRISAVEACLSFPLSFPEIDRVVVGADNVAQLQEIISASRREVLTGLPDLHCDAEDLDLINPAHWARL
jgi:aryl-alcohol dehydrogenase-like predicted oxidoreductase